jgi:hypothetical protein
MIEVKYELERGIDGQAAERAVEKVLRYHQHALAGVTCPTHGNPPWLKVGGQSLDRLTVAIESCCETLAQSIRARMRNVSRRDQE